LKAGIDRQRDNDYYDYNGQLGDLEMPTRARKASTAKGMAIAGSVRDKPPRAVSSALEAQWTVADAKARLSEVIETARSQGPQIITRNGKRSVVVVSVEEWERKSARKGTLLEFFKSSPLWGADLDMTRDDAPPRDLDL
jgi:prevent-host-death family protein